MSQANRSVSQKDGGVFTEQPAYQQETIRFAMLKAQKPGWHQIFLRAIGANWLVCFAVFISISSREISSKIMAIWFPTATFVALALDHVVANMYFIPTAIWVGAPFSIGYYIWKSLIPTALGNIIGGGLFVAAPYWYLYLTGEDDVEVSFNLGPQATAMGEVGGPMPPDRHQNRGPTLTDGVDPTTEKYEDAVKDRDFLPHSGSPMTSGIARELSAEKYAKTKREREEAEGVDTTTNGRVDV